MEPNDKTPFFMLLNKMAAIFCDELSELRQLAYWDLLRDRIGLEEWQQACTAAMQGETFHKVPLPAILWGYVTAYRAEQRRQQEQRDQHERDLARHIKEAERLAMEASPAWQAEQAKQHEQHEQAERQRQEEYQLWLESLSYEDKVLYRIMNPHQEGSQPYRKLTEEELLYTPRGDADVAKRKARAQLQQLMEEATHGTHTGTSTSS